MMAGREGYPDASQMPEIDDTPVDPAQAPEDMKDMNPVVDALKTIQLFAAALENKQDPRAQAVKDGLLAIVQAAAGGAAAGGAAGEAPVEPEAMPEGEMPEAEAGQEEQAQPGAPTPRGAMQRRLGRDMNQGKGSVPLI
jgi:hypothetical protein